MKIICAFRILAQYIPFIFRSNRKIGFWDYLFQKLIARSHSAQKAFCWSTFLLHVSIRKFDFARTRALCLALLNELPHLKIPMRLWLNAVEVAIWLRDKDLARLIFVRLSQFRSENRSFSMALSRLKSLKGWYFDDEPELVRNIVTGEVPSTAYLPCLDYFARAFIYDLNKQLEEAKANYEKALVTFPSESREKEIAKERLIEIERMRNVAF